MRLFIYTCILFVIVITIGMGYKIFNKESKSDCYEYTIIDQLFDAMVKDDTMTWDRFKELTANTGIVYEFNEFGHSPRGDMYITVDIEDVYKCTEYVDKPKYRLIFRNKVFQEMYDL